MGDGLARDILGLVVAVGVVATAAEASARPPEWMRTASISGRITGVEGPLQGARVGVVQLIGGTRSPAANTETGSDGSFVFKRLAPGAFELTVERRRYAKHHKTLWVLPGLNRVNLQLTPAAVIEGVVVDDRNRPVPDARVEATPRRSRRRAGSGRSDRKGRFVVDGLRPGIYRIRARATGYLDAERSAQAPMRGLRLHATRLYRVWGVVLAAPARVRIAGSGIWPGRATTTDGAGVFSFDRVPAGVYELVATGKGDRALASHLLVGLPVGPFPPPPVLLGLEPGQRIAGVVSSTGGRPVPGATVALGVGAGSVLRYRAETDAEGRFALDPVVNGAYRVGVRARGFLPVLSREVQAPAQLPLRLIVSRGGRIHGEVRDTAGAPIDGVVVGVEYAVGVGANRTIGELGVIPGPVPPIPPPGLSFPSGSLVAPVSSVTAATDRNGRYRLAGLLPGKLRLVARHPSYGEERTAWVELSEEKELGVAPLVLSPAASLFVRALDERGRALAGARLTLASSDGSRTAFTDASGSHTFGGLLGRFRVTGELRGYLPSSRRVRLASGQRVELDLALEPARGALAGYIIDANRIPVEGARVVARRGRHRLRCRSDRSGYFRLVGVGKEPLELEVTRTDFVPRRRRVTPSGGREVEIQLAFAASISGKVEDRRTGAPVTSFRLTLSRGKQRRVDIRDARGAFELRGLGPGPLELEVTARGYASRTHRAKVRRAGRPHEVTVSDLVIALDRAGRIDGSVTSAATRRPVAGAKVMAAGRVTRTNTDGRFRLDDVPEGNHRVTVRHGGHTQHSDSVVVRADQTSGPIRIELGTGSTP